MLNKKIERSVLTLKIMKILVVLLAIITIGKLIIVSYVYHDGFSDMAYYQSSVTIPLELPRGEIFDTNGVLLAGNTSTYTLRYVNSGLIDETTEDELAIKIADLIDLSYYEVYDVEIKDMYIQRDDNFTTIIDNMSDKDYANYEKLDEEGDVAAQNEILRSYVSDSVVKSIRKTYGDEALYIRLKMDSATQKDPVIIDSDLSVDEVYSIEQQANQIGGFYVASSWTREYPLDETLSGFLGTVGAMEAEDQDYYESIGYSQNEIVGTSYAEEALEPILHSSPATMELYFDENGNIINSSVIDEGKQGSDVILTIDTALQKAADESIKEELANNSYAYNTSSCTAGVDPDTGFLLFSSGIMEGAEEGEYYDYSTCSFTFASEIGSIAKPASLLLLLTEDAIEQGEVIYDAPMSLQGSPEKASWQNMGYITDKDAIARSSNVYFYKGFIKLAGQEYVEDGPLDVSEENFNLVRKTFSQFGLGVSTGIDMSYENTGLQGSDYLPGFYLDLANGQYDTYTTLQAAQYVATLSNGGTRYKIQYVKSINQPGEFNQPGSIVYETEPVELNTLDMSQDDLNYVKDAMHGVTTRADGTMYLLNPLEAEYDTTIGSKSGTAENFYYDSDTSELMPTTNCSALAFEPLDDPDIAMSVLSPYCAENNDEYNHMNKNITYTILDYYLGREEE